MSNLALRLASAAALLPPVIAAFILGGWWLKGLILLVTSICLWEYGSIVAKHELRSRAALMVVGTIGSALLMFVETSVQAMLVVQLSMMAFASMFVLAPGELATAWRRLATLMFGIIYVGLGMTSIGRLRELGDELQGGARGGFILVAFTATWANDTCAYFAGRAFGKHKMNETISPKKTWEGFAGGAVGTLLFLLGGRFLLADVFGGMTYVDMVLISIPASFLGPMGDLAESMLKRNYDVKDSGKILPGHGGMLDRVDAVFFVAPWTLGYLVVLKPMVDRLLAQ